MNKTAHRMVMADVAQEEGWRRGAELGVGHGHLSAALLRACPELTLIGVDLFERPGWEEAARTRLAPYADRCQLRVGSTSEAAVTVPDASLDFVFVDAGHSYEAVREDIAKWWPKVKPGGWFGGHDYHEKFPGVIQAVTERFGEALRHLDGWVWWVRR